MKALHTRDEKNRLQMAKIVEKTFYEGKGQNVCFLGDHIMICSQYKFEEMIDDLAKELGSEEVARLALSGESIDFELDSQGRLQIPKDYLQGSFEEKDCYIVSVKGKSQKDNYIEIFPKTVYEQLIDTFLIKTSFTENSGLKGQMNKLKGDGNEERRRED